MESSREIDSSRAARWHRRAQRALTVGDLDAAGRACARLIELEPNHADAYYIAAVCTLEGGYPSDALLGFQRATSLDQNRPDYWAGLARCQALLGQSNDAGSSAARALALPISDAATHDTLGNVFTWIARHQDAVDQFEMATRLAPEHAQLHYHLGTSLMYCGELDRAAASFSRVLEIDPAQDRAHLALSELLSDSPPAGRIEQLERALDGVRGQVDRELIVSQALARTLETADEPGRAFAVWSTSKKAKKDAVGYTIEDDKAIFSRFRELFGQDARRDLRPGHATDAPIFVIGMPRSGTTLVERILASHPAIVSGGELIGMPQAVAEAGGSRAQMLIDIDALGSALEADPAGIGARYLEKTRAAVGDAARFVDKLPLNFFFVGFIRRSLPNARIVCLRRGALDTCIANFRQLFALNFPFYRYALTLEDTAEYFAMFDQLIDFWDQQLPGALHQVRYERLVDDPESEVRSLLDHLELEYLPEVLDFDRQPLPVATASAVQVRRPIYKDSVNAWRRYENELKPTIKRLKNLGIDPGISD